MLIRTAVSFSAQTESRSPHPKLAPKGASENASGRTHNQIRSDNLDPTTNPPSHRTLAIMADNTPTSASDMLNGAQSRAAKAPEEIAKETDLLPRLITHLDRHLIFPLLQFVAEQQEEEDGREITKAKFDLLEKTNMTDYVASLYCELNDTDEAPKEFATKRQDVLDKLDLFSQESEKITDLLSREDVVTSLRSDKVANLEYLKKEHDVCPRSSP